VFKAKRQYEKSHRESDKALDAYRKSDADIHLSRADVEKVSTESLLFICLNGIQKIKALHYFAFPVETHWVTLSFRNTKVLHQTTS